MGPKKLLQFLHTHTLKQIFWPDAIDDDYLLAARKRLIATISLLVGSMGIVSGGVSLLSTISQAPLLSLFALLGPIIVLIAPVYIAKTNQLDIGGLILVSYLTIHISILTISNGGLMWPAVIYMSGIPFLASLTLGTRYGLIIAVIIAFLITASTYISVPGWIGFMLVILVIGSTLATTIFLREMERTTNRLVELKDDAQTANKNKSDFLANMSHEIRTPLNGIIGILQLLSDFEQSKDQTHLINVGSASANSLLIILNDILDISKIVATGMELEKISFNRDQIIDSVFSIMGHSAQEKNIQLKLSIDESIPIRLIGDPTRLQQVVTNFVSNAIKFTEHGYVEIRMERGSYSNEVKISIEDTGIGMTEEACQRVFNKFEQAETSTSRKFGGTGLGLAISKQLVELHGGKVGVTSKPGEGSIFWFTFPLIEGEAFAVQEQSTISPNISFHEDVRVLVAEDNRTNRLIVKRFLKKFDITPHIVKDGQEAVEETLKEKFDIIFMDIQMPNKDGITATQEIRQKQNQNNKTPIIALTANIMKDQQTAYIQKGITACLEKPLKISKLKTTLQEYITHTDKLFKQENAKKSRENISSTTVH